jgi:periplasmic protein TonB
MQEVCEGTNEAGKKEEQDKSFETAAAKKDTEGEKGKRSQNARGIEFADLLLENPHLKRPRKWADVLVSLAGQIAFVIVLLLIPLYYTHGLDLPKFEKTMLISPPPPPPPPPPPSTVHVMPKPKATLFDNNRLIAPRAIPKQVEMVKEQPPPAASAMQGVAGGVPGGVPGGTLGGVLGGVLSPASRVPAPPRKPVAHGPLRVGGQIQAPRLIHNVQPVYPPLARQTRTQGEVVLDCVIDKQGNVTQMRLISGHPLLVGAAMQAVRQWKYQPTLLNGTPVAVQMMVHVNFSLGGY